MFGCIFGGKNEPKKDVDIFAPREGRDSPGICQTKTGKTLAVLTLVAIVAAIAIPILMKHGYLNSVGDFFTSKVFPPVVNFIHSLPNWVLPGAAGIGAGSVLTLLLVYGGSWVKARIQAHREQEQE